MATVDFHITSFSVAWLKASRDPRIGHHPLWHSMPGYTIAGGADRADPVCQSSLPLTWHSAGPEEKGVKRGQGVSRVRSFAYFRLLQSRA